MLVPDRVCGIETEFAAMLEKQNHEIVAPRDVFSSHYRRHMWRHCPDGLYTCRELGVNDRLWHKNGSLIYVDYNDHPEHATAECRHLRDVVAQVKAGELIMADIFREPLELTDGRVILFKNNISWNEQGNVESTYACDDNYSLPPLLASPAIDDLYSFLIPFLITRQLLDGSGTWDRDGNFLLSQRATQIELVTSGIATQNRPIIKNRSSGDTGNRLQIVLGDSNMLEPALFLKVGTTMLVLALCEIGRMRQMSCLEPVKALHDIALSNDPHERLIMFNNRDQLSALEVQYLYLNDAKKYLPDACYESEATRQEFMEVLDLWERTLEAIGNHDVTWMLGRLDHATKYYLFEQALRAKKFASGDEIAQLRRSLDILYHGISDCTIHNSLKKRFSSRRIVSDEEIMRAKEFPPVGTRAQLRSKFVRKALEVPDNSTWFPEWNHCMYRGHGSIAHVALDPFIGESESFDNFLAGLH